MPGTAASSSTSKLVQLDDTLWEIPAASRADMQLTVLIHSGSRGLGHQVCTDYVRTMDAVQAHYGIELPDRQLACAPASSVEGRAYLAAMAAAANFAFANRQALAHAVREAIRRVLGHDAAAATRQVYDVAHNVAKVEHQAGATFSSTARARLAPSRPGRPRSPRTSSTWANPCSSPAAWAPPATSSPASRARSSAPSARPATARVARSECVGFRADSDEGRIGFVEDVLVDEDEHATGLVLRAGVLGNRVIVVPAQAVERVEPRQRRLVVRNDVRGGARPDLYARGAIPGSRFLYAAREIRCRNCGYGAVVRRTPSECPMCGRGEWQVLASSPPALQVGHSEYANALLGSGEGERWSV